MPIHSMLTVVLSPLHILSMQLSPSSLSGLRLPYNCRESLVAIFLYAAAGMPGLSSGQIYLNCGRALLPVEGDEEMPLLEAFADILARSGFLISGIFSNPDGPIQQNYELDPDLDVRFLHIWTALMKAQERLAQGDLEKAIASIKHLQTSWDPSPPLVPLTSSLAVQNGRGELPILEGLIQYGAKAYDVSWHCFQHALQSGMRLGNLSEHSTKVALGFSILLHLSCPQRLPCDPSKLPGWQAYNETALRSHDHRVIFFRLMHCLIDATYSDMRFFEARISAVSYLLRESVSTIAFAFLSELEEIARSVVLFRRLGIEYDLQKELHSLQARCPLYIWLSPIMIPASANI